MNAPISHWDAHAHVFAGPVQAGSHYTPDEYSLAMWRATAEPHGINRVVLVQPSVYGFDNSVMLDALTSSGGVHRGVAVVDACVTDQALEIMHAAGVRGVRFNLVSPVGNDAADIDAVIARVRPLGWHVQFFLKPSHYAWVHERQAAWGVTVVLDHLAGVRVNDGDSEDIAALFALADQGAWLKVSGYYRLGAVAPFDDIDAMIESLHGRFAGRMVWGSDWPHTWFMETARRAAPPYEMLLAPLLRVFSDTAIGKSILCDAPERLYR